MSPQNCPNHLNFLVFLHLFSLMMNDLALQTTSKQIPNKNIQRNYHKIKHIKLQKPIQNKKSNNLTFNPKIKNKIYHKTIPSTQIIRTLHLSKKDSPNGHSKNQSKNHKQIC